MKLLATAFFLLAWTHITRAQTNWVQTNGPQGGAITAVCVDSIDHVWIGTEADGVLETQNEGDNWFSRSTGLTSLHIRVEGLEASPRPYVFALTTDAGLFRYNRSDNPHWEALDTTRTFGQILAMTVDASGTFYLGTQDFGVLISSDNGDHWQTADTGLDGNAVIQIRSVPGGKLLALSSTGALFVSNNAAKTWAKLAKNDSGGSPTALLPLTGNAVLYGDQRGNVFRYAGSGTWTNVLRNTGWIYSLFRNPKNSHLFCRTLSGQLYRSLDTGSTWSLANGDTIGGALFPMAADTQGAIFSGTDYSGMTRSRDDGAIFQTIDFSVIATYIYVVANAPNNDAYAADATFIYRSTDRGENWEMLNIELPELTGAGPSFSIDSTNVLFAGSQDGVWVSRDTGHTWNRTLGPPKNFASNLCYALAATKNTVWAATQFGLSMSKDHGLTWSPVPAFNQQQMYGITIGLNGVLYTEDQASNMYSSKDGGINWTQLSSGAGLSVVTSHGMMFSVSNNALAVSHDTSQSWQTIYVPDSLHARSVNSVVSDYAAHLFTSTDSGVYRSDDLGTNWQSVSNGLEGPSATRLSAIHMVCEDRQGIYYAASHGQGVFRDGPAMSVTQNAINTAAHLLPFPNPASGTISLSFSLPAETKVTIELSDVLGRTVFAESKRMTSGDHSIPIDCNSLVDGNYIARVFSNERSSSTIVTIEH